MSSVQIQNLVQFSFDAGLLLSLSSFFSLLMQFVIITVINGDTDIDISKKCYKKLI